MPKSDVLTEKGRFQSDEAICLGDGPRNVDGVCHTMHGEFASELQQFAWLVGKCFYQS